MDTYFLSMIDSGCGVVGAGVGAAPLLIRLARAGKHSMIFVLSDATTGASPQHALRVCESEEVLLRSEANEEAPGVCKLEKVLK